MVRRWHCAAARWPATAQLCAALAAAVLAWPAHADDVADVVGRVKRSVVAIGTFDRTRTPQFAFRGTGFVVDDGTVIATNAHVVPGALENPRVQMGILIPQADSVSGTFREARVVATDPGTDLALLKVTGAPLPTLRIGDSDRVREGQDILLSGFPIGAALGPFAATHRGLIAAIAPIAIPQARSAELDAKVVRRLTQGSFNIFQLDATAYPGNSGSPIYDPRTGDVLGIVNMVLVKSTKEAVLSQPSGISYAVPARYLAELLQKAR